MPDRYTDQSFSERIQLSFKQNNMSGIEVIGLLPDDLRGELVKTTVKEKQPISDVIKNYGTRLQGFIRKRVQNSEDADDILQEVY